jgi:hypothetical protein
VYVNGWFFDFSDNSFLDKPTKEDNDTFNLPAKENFVFCFYIKR